MSVPAPHFLLRARASRHDRPGRWSFMLESNDGSHSLKVEDDEPNTHGERLELLALVRGLEAVPQPARVTVVATSPYVNRVLNGGLDEWRASGWRWERHGEMVPVKNADLWQRVDRALNFHSVECRAGVGNQQRCEEARIPPPHFPIDTWRLRDQPSPDRPTETAGALVATRSTVDATMPTAAGVHRNRRACRKVPQAADESSCGGGNRRKSLSRNAVALGLSLGRRFQKTARRWRVALAQLAADDEFEWSD